MVATISDAFAEDLIRTCNDPSTFGVHLLFNQFWAHCPPEVADAYVAPFRDDPALVRAVAERHYGEPLTVEALAAAPAGSLGEACHAFIVDNGLEEKLAVDYRRFHEALEEGGALDGMPVELRYAVLRGFQLHDLIHVVTGYGPSARDEIALQAFCLAQLQFPYFAMWMSVVTTRMAFIDPDSTVGMMDAIAEGWRYGRSVQNVQLERWEDQLARPLAEVRERYGIDPAGRRSLRGG